MVSWTTRYERREVVGAVEGVVPWTTRYEI